MFKKICLLTVLALFLANIMPAEERWSLILTSKINLPQNKLGLGSPGINIAGFTDDKHGIAIGGLWLGKVLYTLDGGNNWNLESPPGFPGLGIDNLEILDNDQAWCYGEYFLSFTVDGGKNWSSLPNIGSEHQQGHYLSFVSSSVGWLGMVNRVFVTHDGGTNWTNLTLPDYLRNDITAVQALSENSGYILLKSGVLGFTKDNGENWKTISLPVKDRQLSSSVIECSVHTVRFQDDFHGTVVLYFEKPRGFVVLQTADGGKTWLEEKLPVDIKAGYLFLSHDRKYLTINDLFEKKIYLFKHI